jgi:hypothetical protein
LPTQKIAAKHSHPPNIRGNFRRLVLRGKNGQRVIHHWCSPLHSSDWFQSLHNSRSHGEKEPLEQGHIFQNKYRVMMCTHHKQTYLPTFHCQSSRRKCKACSHGCNTNGSTSDAVVSPYSATLTTYKWTDRTQRNQLCALPIISSVDVNMRIIFGPSRARSHRREGSGSSNCRPLVCPQIEFKHVIQPSGAIKPPKQNELVIMNDGNVTC